MRAGVIFDDRGRETKPKPPKPRPAQPPPGQTGSPGHREVTADDLAAAVNIASVHYGVRPYDVTTETQRRRATAARSLAYAVLRQAGYSLTAIGIAFDRHHTTVMAGMRHTADNEAAVAAAYRGFLLLRSLPKEP